MGKVRIQRAIFNLMYHYHYRCEECGSEDSYDDLHAGGGAARLISASEYHDIIDAQNECSEQDTLFPS